MTVRQLADTLGLHDGEIEKIEKGMAPKRGLLLKLADRLRCSQRYAGAP
jgi:transcriptional regulator with XRE-family HTH domain